MLEFNGCVNLSPATVQWPLNATSDRISAHVFDCSYQEPPPKFVFNAQAPRSLKNPVFTLELRGVGPNKEIVFLLPTSMGWDDRKRPLARVVVFFSFVCNKRGWLTMQCIFVRLLFIGHL